MPFVELTPKAKVFEPLADWLAKASVPIEPPVQASDWVAAGDIAFWSGRHKLVGAIPQHLRGGFPAELPGDLGPTEMGLLISGLHALDPVAFANWHERHVSGIKKRFLQQTGSLHLEDDGQLVTVAFPIALLDGGEPDGTGERRALLLLRQIHDLFPHRPRIATQSIGADLLRDILPFDPTSREVEALKLVSNRVAGLNGLFGNLVTYRHARRATWQEYAETIVGLRRTVSEAFRGLHRGWAKLITQTKPARRRQNGSRVES